jgi:hypothetical protein
MREAVCFFTKITNAMAGRKRCGVQQDSAATRQFHRSTLADQKFAMRYAPQIYQEQISKLLPGNRELLGIKRLFLR